MQLYLVFLSALAPVAVLLWYIYRKDRMQPEPTKWLLKAFCFGIMSVPLSLAFSIPTQKLLGAAIDASTYPSFLNSLTDAFLLAAIPEEVAKLIMLWLLLRKNPYFDEQFDGIVYAVCIGMGFAGLENIMYLIRGLEDGSWIGTGIVRTLFSVPAHFLFAILMGYYYSIYHFAIGRSIKAMVMILIAPILAHGIYDSLLFSVQIDENLSAICMIVFLIFFNRLKKRGKERIGNLINK